MRIYIQCKILLNNSLYIIYFMAIFVDSLSDYHKVSKGSCDSFTVPPYSMRHCPALNSSHSQGALSGTGRARTGEVGAGREVGLGEGRGVGRGVVLGVGPGVGGSVGRNDGL